MKQRDSAMPERLARFVARGEEDRPRWLLALTLLSMFAAAATAGVVAVITGGGRIFCTVTTRLSGADIPLAAYIVVAVCSFGFAVSILVRARPRLLSMNLLLAACALLTGIVLVARVSAVSTAVESCSFMGSYTETFTDHVWYVYIVWGVALGVLLLQAGRLLARRQCDLRKRRARGVHA